MKQFLTRMAGFASLFAAVTLCLLLIDLYVYDYDSNQLLNDREKLENKVVIIGSSKINRALIIDSVEKYMPVKVYAEIGQYSLESMNFIMRKYKNGEIGKGNTIFLNLEADDKPIQNSCRNFNWFAQNFIIDEHYNWSTFSIEEYPKIISRIYVDILDMGVNRTKPFEVSLLGVNKEKGAKLFDLKSYRNYCNNCSDSIGQDELLKANMGNMARTLKDIEAKTGSQIYLLVPPGSHMINNAEVYRQFYPANKVIDMSCLDGLDNEKLWFDYKHVNAEGAQIFTKKFVEMAENIVLRKQS